MIWEAVAQCRCSKSERFVTVPCRFDLWYFQNVVVSERIFRVFHMDKIMKTDRCKFINYFICFQEIPQIKSTRYGNKSFRFAAPTLWNSLPDHFRTENSFSQFKSLLQSWNGSKCRCSACRWLKFCFCLAYILIFLFFISSLFKKI
jgi:hypothetical protein